MMFESRKCTRLISVLLTMVLIFTCMSGLCGCGKENDDDEYRKNELLDTSEEIVLRIASNQEAWPEMDNVIAKFEKVYPNCSVVYERIEEYQENLPVRLKQEEQKVDIFRSSNIQPSCTYTDDLCNLLSDYAKQYLDLSQTNRGLVENFRYTGAENTQYAIPFGGELRGMYVNVTLLNKFNLQIPKNRSELLRCCEVLYQNGYIPLQSSPGTFGQQLLYPYICNSIVNGGSYEAMYNSIENIEPGISEYFRDAYSFLYNIVEKGYFDYKTVEEKYGYTFAQSEAKAKEFLNVKKVSADSDIYEKQDDVGNIAFLPDTQGFELHLKKAKSDYHSEIEYAFIMSPVGEDGGYAYLSPADGLAVNRHSEHLDWALEFMNFFFTPEVNRAFSEESGKIPNTEDALLRFDIPENRSCGVGQVTFGYTFYKTVTSLMISGYSDMISITKMNAKKYMTDNGDGTYSLTFTLEDYMKRLETEFQKIKQSR